MFNFKALAADAVAVLNGWASPARLALLFFAAYALLAFGYSLAIGPLRGPDERNHLLRAYQISEGGFATSYRAGDGWVGDDLPASLARLAAVLEDHKVHRIEPSQLGAARGLRLAPEQRQFVEFSTAPYAPLAYLPAAAAIAVGRLADAAPLTLLYLGRWANVIAASALIALAIRFGGYAAPGLCVVALFPMTISQVAVVSADALSFAIAFLWIAVVLKAAVEPDDSLRGRRIWLLLALAIALSQLRPPFPLLGLLAFAIPLRRAGRSRRALVTTAAALAATILPAVAWNAHAMHLQTKPIIDEHVAPAEQLRHITENPGAFLRALKRDLSIRGYEYWRQAVGRLGWMNIWLPEWIPAGFLVVLGCAVFAGVAGASPPTAAQRCLLCAGAIAGVVGVELMLYLTFNGVASRFIRGVQGRYFIPVIVLVAFAVSHPLLAGSRWRPRVLVGCALFIVAAHVGTFITLSRAAAGE